MVFLGVALYNANFLQVPQIFSISSLIASFIFLFSGFVTNAISWNKVLRESNYHVELSTCISGVGLSIFGKYIPGKIWMVMGRAAYIAERNYHSIGKLSAISLNAQFIALWIGLIFGVTGLFLLGGLHLWGWLILCLWVVLTVVIFCKPAHAKAERAIGFFLRKTITLPRLTVKSTFLVMPWFVLYWAFWSIGFYMLVISLIKLDVPWSVGFAFPLAGTLGIMTLISPGGLGTREAVLVGYLTLAGIPVLEATTIAVASRLWFLGGEAFIFIVGWITHKRLHKAVHKAA
jgi:uncharacterized membrane protein YbhN (UPF0104 family)